MEYTCLAVLIKDGRDCSSAIEKDTLKIKNKERKIKTEKEKMRRFKFIFANFWLKVMSLFMAIVTWFYVNGEIVKLIKP